MSTFMITIIFLLIIGVIVYFMYKNEKKHKDTISTKPKANTQKKSYQPIERPTRKPKAEPTTVQPKPVAKPTVVPQEVPTQPKVKEIPKIELPVANYPQFSHARLLDMGLSDDDAQEFVQDLIEQIKTQIPLIETAIQSGNFQEIEELTHSIKGSATNIGVGGISDLLVDFNTYVKTGDTKEILEAYVTHVKTYHKQLQEQYS